MPHKTGQIQRRPEKYQRLYSPLFHTAQWVSSRAVIAAAKHSAKVRFIIVFIQFLLFSPINSSLPHYGSCINLIAAKGLVFVDICFFLHSCALSCSMVK